AMPSDDAVRLLVHMANLRGGPDNITVMIVRVPGGSSNGNGVKGSKPGGLQRAAAAWNRLVPWPYTVLAGGCALALLSMGMRVAEIPGALVLFALAAVVILAGLVGLIVHLKKEPEERPETTEDAARSLNIYKRHQCTVSPELTARFTELENSLAEALKSQEVAVDWD